MVSEQTATNTITINAAEQDHLIDSVTVFQAGRAEIKRRVQLELKQGQNRIDIEHLPNCINEDSVRVQGSGTAVIFDVVYHSPYRQRTPDPSTDGEDSDEDSDEEYAQRYCSLQTLRKERNVVKQQSDFLDSYGRTLNSQNFGLDDIERFLDIYATRQNALEQRTQEIDLQITQAEKALAIGKGQAKKPQDNYDLLAERRTKITVTVLSKERGKAELLLTYVVSKASWIPIYDVRASLGQSPGKSSTVEVHYRASITQTTGEDWPEVGLTLSTAAPHRGATMPTLPTWRIGLPAPRPPRPPIPAHARIVSSISTHSFASHRSRSRSRSPTRIIMVEGSARSPNIIRTTAHPADAAVEVPMDYIRP
ncbi:Protein F37C4,5 [Ceratobasidium theobromae]|uniref:Protein F37C4,5 n=1 Tax=Ceratobasidium theobromae TaxID=1582974 RepID=A0A5N5QL70_9AGAM|nr:Protein F37C4,5 [Ceratobasidium theobromae]